jgi:hypothetical protein
MGQDVLDGIHHRHRAILLAQRRGNRVCVAVLQTWQHTSTGKIDFAGCRPCQLPNVSRGADRYKAIAANGDRFRNRTLRPHRHDAGVVVDRVGGGLWRRTLCKKSGGEERDADSCEEHYITDRR